MTLRLRARQSHANPWASSFTALRAGHPMEHYCCAQARTHEQLDARLFSGAKRAAAGSRGVSMREVVSCLRFRVC